MTNTNPEGHSPRYWRKHPERNPPSVAVNLQPPGGDKESNMPTAVATAGWFVITMVTIVLDRYASTLLAIIIAVISSSFLLSRNRRVKVVYSDLSLRFKRCLVLSVVVVTAGGSAIWFAYSPAPEVRITIPSSSPPTSAYEYTPIPLPLKKPVVQAMDPSKIRSVAIDMGHGTDMYFENNYVEGEIRAEHATRAYVANNHINIEPIVRLILKQTDARQSIDDIETILTTNRQKLLTEWRRLPGEQRNKNIAELDYFERDVRSKEKNMDEMRSFLHHWQRTH